MGMKNIKLFPFGHFRHFAGQCQIIGRIFKHGILVDFNLMKINVAIYFIQLVRDTGRNKMNFMSSFRKQFAEFGRDDSRSADTRITCDSDF